LSQRRPDFNERAVAALRQLTFEEPASRFARLLKTVAKYLGGNSISACGAASANTVVGAASGTNPGSAAENRTAQALLVCAQLYGPPRGVRFDSCFDAGSESNLVPAAVDFTLAESALLAGAASKTGLGLAGSEILALALALDDLRLFSATALSNWYNRYWTALTPQTESMLLFDPFREAVLTAISEGLSQEARAWLRASLWSTIDLTELAGEGSSSEKLGSEKLGSEKLGSVLDFLAGCNSKLSEIGDLAAVCALIKDCSEELVGHLRPELVLLVEGQTEAIILPHVAKVCGVTSSPAAVAVVASGGAQQVVRRYLTLKDSLRLPIICVLDGDASQSAEMIDDSLRACDYLVSLTVNELEDSYSYELLLEMLNKYLGNHGQTLSQSGFSLPRSGARKDPLRKLLRQRGLGDFDKIAFAHIAVDSLTKAAQVPDELLRVMDTVKNALCVCRGGALESD
jgi:hypothetical protein